jgi:hypothetical protein
MHAMRDVGKRHEDPSATGAPNTLTQAPSDTRELWCPCPQYHRLQHDSIFRALRQKGITGPNYSYSLNTNEDCLLISKPRADTSLVTE